MTRLAFSDEGAGDPLVLIHAGIADARMWHPQADRFAGDWRIVRPDLRGFGGTAHSEGEYRHAADLVRGLVLVDATYDGFHFLGQDLFDQ